MKNLVHNLLQTLQRFKFASTLNILGLSVAFLSLIVILMEFRYGVSYNKCYDDYKNISRLEVSSDSATYDVTVGFNWKRMLDAEFPQIDRTELLRTSSGLGEYLQIERGGAQAGFKEESHRVTPGFPELFGFSMAEGTIDALASPGSIMLPLSMARRFWPEESALGRQLRFPDADTALTVGGVYRDLLANGMVENVIYCAIPGKMGTEGGWSTNYQLFTTLRPGTRHTELERAIYERFMKEETPPYFRNYKSVRLNPIENLYFDPSIGDGPVERGNPREIALLLALALLITAVASVNYINFAISLTPLRIRNINTQKIFGNPVSRIRLALVGEAAAISLIAYLISLALLPVARKYGIGSLLRTDMDMASNLGILLFGAAIALAAGAVAGLYPAFYSTRISPALAVKGSFGMSPKGRRLRTALISFQFVISAVLIIAAVFLHLQNRFVRGADLGYSHDQVITADLGNLLEDPAAQERFRNELFKSPQVLDMAASFFPFGSGGAQPVTFMRDGEPVSYDFQLPVTPGLLRCFDIPVIAGRDFEESDRYTPGIKVILNEAAAQRFELKPGDTFDDRYTVVGITPNYHFKSLHEGNTAPVGLVVIGESMPMRVPMRNVYVRVAGDPHTAAEHVRQSVAAVDPAYPLTVRFFDEVFDLVYRADLKAARLITLFSLIAVALSLMGVFGLVVFETQYRRREIAVRRVFGAQVGELLVMFNRRYVQITAVCFVVAAPVAYYGVTEWLRGFEYRTPVYWWVFVLTFLSVASVTAAVVTILSWKTANTNPADALKRE